MCCKHSLSVFTAFKREIDGASRGLAEAGGSVGGQEGRSVAGGSVGGRRDGRGAGGAVGGRRGGRGAGGALVPQVQRERATPGRLFPAAGGETPGLTFKKWALTGRALGLVPQSDT